MEKLLQKSTDKSLHRPLPQSHRRRVQQVFKRLSHRRQCSRARVDGSHASKNTGEESEEA